MTLNPRWNTTFNIPLPCPKPLASRRPSEADVSCSTSSPEACSASDETSRGLAVCKENGLLNFWGDGQIKIQIIDGDRFNQDIFLGEVVYVIDTAMMPPP